MKPVCIRCGVVGVEFSDEECSVCRDLHDQVVTFATQEKDYLGRQQYRGARALSEPDEDEKRIETAHALVAYANAVLWGAKKTKALRRLQAREEANPIPARGAA
jgi:hypothetical protein